MEYHKTKDILHFKKILDFKSIKKTLIYIQLEEAVFADKDDGFICKVAGKVEEAKG